MKKIILLSFGMLFLFSCQKSAPINVSDNHTKEQTIAWNTDLYVTKAKYTRDFIINDKGKYDCSTSGKNCNVTKSSVSQLDQLAILDSYITSGNSVGYFAHHNWPVIFPEITNAGINALMNHQIFIYKKSGNNDALTYLLSTSTSSDQVVADNIIAVWQFQ
ncbi:MAG: hypothetical protein BGO31_09720 [Bacteroidetes bacterium 43-16]|nr:MAG: hypothetical protein BGO31_09720 [Bacteroidetes bacterium 43-16]